MAHAWEEKIQQTKEFHRPHVGITSIQEYL